MCLSDGSGTGTFPVVVTLMRKSFPDCDSDSNDSDDIMQRTHTVVFKCIGTNKEESYQEVLAKSNRRLRNGENVPVRLNP